MQWTLWNRQSRISQKLREVVIVYTPCFHVHCGSQHLFKLFLRKFFPVTMKKRVTKAEGQRQ
jgi:hypothetical protein